MNSHELARLLLTMPDLPVATHALNHTYMSGIDRSSHSPLKIGRLHTYGGDHIVIGNISKRNINKPNWYVTEMLHGDALTMSRRIECTEKNCQGKCAIASAFAEC